MDGLPNLFFRLRENGAQVFRLSADGHNRRLEMDPLAMVVLRSGEIKAQGGRDVTEEERAEINAWVVARREEVARRNLDGIYQTVEALNQAAHWAQTKASADELDKISDDLMLAMHDLRQVLVRKKAERAQKR